MIGKNAAINLSLGFGVMGLICLYLSASSRHETMTTKGMLTGALAFLAMSPIALLVYKCGDRRLRPVAVLAIAMFVVWCALQIGAIWMQSSRAKDNVVSSAFVIVGCGLFVVPALVSIRDKGDLISCVVGALTGFSACVLLLISTWSPELLGYEDERYGLTAASVAIFGSLGTHCLHWIMTQRQSVIPKVWAAASVVGLGLSVVFIWWIRD